jgi:hypothetical protein
LRASDWKTEERRTKEKAGSRRKKQGFGDPIFSEEKTLFLSKLKRNFLEEPRAEHNGRLWLPEALT